MCKDVQCHLPLGKCKLRPFWDTVHLVDQVKNTVVPLYHGGYIPGIPVDA